MTSSDAKFALGKFGAFLHHSVSAYSYVWHDLFMLMTWRICMSDMTHSFMWRDAFVRVASRLHMRDATQSYAWHDAFMCVTWYTYCCDTMRAYCVYTNVSLSRPIHTAYILSSHSHDLSILCKDYYCTHKMHSYCKYTKISRRRTVHTAYIPVFHSQVAFILRIH